MSTTVIGSIEASVNNHFGAFFEIRFYKIITAKTWDSNICADLNSNNNNSSRRIAEKETLLRLVGKE